MGKRRSAQTAWMLTSLTLTSRSWTPVILTQWTASVSCIGATSTQITPLPPYSTAAETQSYSRWEPSSVLALLCTCRLNNPVLISGIHNSALWLVVWTVIMAGLSRSPSKMMRLIWSWSLKAFLCSLPCKPFRIMSRLDLKGHKGWGQNLGKGISHRQG